MKYKILAMAAAAVTAGFLSFGSAQAANVMSGASAVPVIQTAQAGNVQLANHRHNRWRWRRHHNGFGGSGVWLGFGAPLYGGGYGGYPYYAYDDDYDDDYIVPRGGSRHVRYCLDRYRTYNMRTNTFRGYDGYLHQCRSPYRY